MILKLREFFPDELLDKLGWPEEEPETSMLVVTGKNFVGKSLVRRLYTQIAKQEKIESIHLSMQGRTTFGSMASMIYGDEGRTATGVLSGHIIKAGFHNFRQRRNPVLAIYDEPELGMSEEMQLGVVDYLVEQQSEWPESLTGIVFMTHSRIIAEGLVKRCQASFINMGGQYPTVDEWLARPLEPMGLEEASDLCHKRFLELMPFFKKD